MNEPIVRADKAHFQGLTQGHMDRIRRGIGLAIDSEVIGMCAFHWHRRIGETVPHEPFLKLDDVVIVGDVGHENVGNLRALSALPNQKLFRM
jgi:hypothetical protein